MDDLYSSSFESDGEEDLATISKHVSAGVRRTGPKTKQVNGFDPQLLEDAVRQLQRLNHQRLANCSSPSTASQRSFRPVRNRTFTDDQVHRIDRENGILVRKIIEQQLRPVSSYMAINNNSITTKGLRQQQSSASINRRRKQQQIDHDNLVALHPLSQIQTHLILFFTSCTKHSVAAEEAAVCETITAGDSLERSVQALVDSFIFSQTLSKII